MANCLDPAIEAGRAAKDEANGWIAVMSPMMPAKGAPEVVVGIGIKGRYFGCKVKESDIGAKSKLAVAKRLPMYFRLSHSSVPAFELDISTETRRVLGGRAIAAPWDVVDRSDGVTGSCTPSQPVAFDSFLASILATLSARRCTLLETQSIVGEHQGPVSASKKAK